MRKLIKFTSILFTILIVLFIAACFALYLFVNTDQLKNYVSEKVSSMTGRQLTIKGQLHLSFFPWLGVKIDDVSLSNAKGFTSQNFAEVKTVDAKFKVLPLLKGKIEVGAINLDGLQLHLAKNAQGITNWQDLQKQKNTSATDEKQATNLAVKNSSQNKKNATDFQIASINVRNANIDWHDQQHNQTVLVKDFNFSSNHVQAGGAFPVKMSFMINSNKPQLTGKFNLTAKITYANNDRIAIDELDMGANLNGKAFPQHKLQASIQGTLNANLALQTLDVSHLLLKLDQLTANIKLKGNKIIDAPQFAGSIKVASFNPRQLIESLGLGKVKLKSSSALKNANANINFTATANNAAIAKLVVKLDQSTLTGQAQVNNFKSPAINFNLHLDQINLDHYRDFSLQTAASNKSITPPSSNHAKATAKSEQPIIPVALLRRLNMTGKLKIDQATLQDAPITNITANIVAKDGLVQLTSSNANFLQGKYSGKGQIDARSDLPSLAFQANLANVQAGDILKFNSKKFLGVKRITGIANADLNVTAKGSLRTQLIQSLNGDANVAFSNGEIDGLDIDYQFKSLQNKVFAMIGKQAPRNDLTDKGKTDFLSLTATSHIVNGTANNNVKLVSKVLTAEALGPIDLLNQQMNIQIMANLSGIKSGSQYVEALNNMEIPLRVSGNFANPRLHIDNQQLIKNVVKAQEQNIKQKTVDKVTNLIDKKIGNKLNQDVGGKINSLLKHFGQ